MQAFEALGADGWISPGPCLVHAPSPHADARPSGTSIDLIVVHGISLPEGCFEGDHVTDLFLGRLDCDAHPSFAALEGLRVSAHFLVRRNGLVIQYVSCLERAWHAGVSSFMGRSGCNDFSIGVELEGCDAQAYEPVQLERLAELCRVIQQAHPSCVSIAGHSDIAPGRKTDPGPCFDWDRLHQLLRSCKTVLHRQPPPHAFS